MPFHVWTSAMYAPAPTEIYQNGNDVICLFKVDKKFGSFYVFSTHILKKALLQQQQQKPGSRDVDSSSKNSFNFNFSRKTLLGSIIR